MKKQLLMLLLIIGSSNLLADKFESLRKSTLAKLGASVLVGGAVKYTGQAASENNTIKKIGKSLGVNPNDVSKAGAIASGFVTFAAIESQESMEHLVGPALALIGWLAPFYSPVQKVIKKVPLIGDFVDCDNPECTGTCKECILAKGATGCVTSLCLLEGGKFVLSKLPKK